MKQVAKIGFAVMAAILPEGASAATTISMSFTGVSNLGAASYVFTPPSTTTTSNGVSYTDIVSGSFSLDTNAGGISVFPSSFGGQTNFSALVDGAAGVQYSFASTGLNPSPLGALTGGSVFARANNSPMASDYEYATFYSTNTLLQQTIKNPDGSTTYIDSYESFYVYVEADIEIYQVSGQSPYFSIVGPINFQNSSYNVLKVDTTRTFSSDFSLLSMAGTQQRSLGRLTSFSSDLVTSAVPEPTTWAMLLMGFGMIGAASRYRRRSTITTFA